VLYATARKDHTLFGPHLIIDGSKCDTTKLGDRLLIERILSDFPPAIGMTRIGGPYMFEYQAPDPAYSGVSGLVVIAESHIAIHTFPALDYFTMDIFSCKNFDHEVAIDYIRDALHVREMDRMLVQRGLSFRGPHHGPLGATDELIEAARTRNEGLGTTIGSIPTDDPLYPRAAITQAGKMLWPTYGVTPDRGTYEAEAVEANGGVRGHARVLPVNAAAAGDSAPTGLLPVQPMPLNPTASTSGLLERLMTMGGQGRLLGKALAQWETLARTDAPVILALGPHLIGAGVRDLVVDLIRRGHVSALILEGDTLLADAYESLGYRHYVPADDEAAVPTRSATEWEQARAQLTTLLPRTANVPSTTCLAQELGQALDTHAPRPGILALAARHHLPVIALGATDLDAMGIASVDTVADTATLHALLAQSGAGVIALGTTAALADLLGAHHAPCIAIDAVAPPTATVTCRVEATLALPLLATAIVQRLPQRAQLTTPNATRPKRDLLPVG
jgi:S-adenosylmethionine decarboxylase